MEWTSEVFNDQLLSSLDCFDPLLFSGSGIPTTSSPSVSVSSSSRSAAAAPGWQQQQLLHQHQHQHAHPTSMPNPFRPLGGGGGQPGRVDVGGLLDPRAPHQYGAMPPSSLPEHLRTSLQRGGNGGVHSAFETGADPHQAYDAEAEEGLVAGSGGTHPHMPPRSFYGHHPTRSLPPGQQGAASTPLFPYRVVGRHGGLKLASGSEVAPGTAAEVGGPSERPSHQPDNFFGDTGHLRSWPPSSESVHSYMPDSKDDGMASTVTGESGAFVTEDMSAEGALPSRKKPRPESKGRSDDMMHSAVAYAEMQMAPSGDGGLSEREEEEAKAKASRDRNREHARNTRLRKKAYVERLKNTVQELSSEREKIERDQRIQQAKQAEQQTVRRKVLHSVFFLRAAGETNVTKWSTILDPNFRMTLPITPYRWFDPSEVNNGQRVVKGVDGMIRDTKSLHTLIQSIGKKNYRGERKVDVKYFSSPEETILMRDLLMCRWLMKTENAVALGAASEVYKQGMLKASFSSENKLVLLELAFDVMSFMQQLPRSTGHDYEVVPNTLSMALQKPDSEARVIGSALPPFQLESVNQEWTHLYGFTQSEATGKTLALLQGPETEDGELLRALHSLRRGWPACCVVQHYPKEAATPLKSFLRLFPLLSDGGKAVTHFQGVFEPIAEESELSPAPEVSSAQQTVSRSLVATQGNGEERASQESHSSEPVQATSTQGASFGARVKAEDFTDLRGSVTSNTKATL
eukprot:CAMPEP_0118975194 /NCGR_PEP_ID=MMETSP1173-20130426/14842_1 /TAXON_ID=1034831 /ORGANISM="Rhizochromulina marina cf, Strain CCMP1243" /LENGTH=743 /DNA_ID=CAMNT_0006925035 /DNA_START=61 /DNA_END=2292 /DNA_ORIENTATION=+